METANTANTGRRPSGRIQGGEICGIYKRCEAAERDGHGFYAENAGPYQGV